MLDSPYRHTAPRAEATPVRMSWRSFGSELAAGAMTAAVAVVLFRYVAEGWIGYAIVGVIALIALASVPSAFRQKVADCPRCGATIKVFGDARGYVCRPCRSFLEVARGQLFSSPDHLVNDRAVFGVDARRDMTLPDCCCVCLGPTAKHEPRDVLGQRVDVPHCAEHTGGVDGGRSPFTLWFRSPGYAARVAEANGTDLVGVNTRPPSRTKPRSDRGMGLAFGLGATAVAFASYYLIGFLDDGSHEIVAGNLRGLLLWLVIKLAGKKWIAAAFGAIAVLGFSMFIGSFFPGRNGRNDRPKPT